METSLASSPKRHGALLSDSARRAALLSNKERAKGAPRYTQLFKRSTPTQIGLMFATGVGIPASATTGRTGAEHQDRERVKGRSYPERTPSSVGCKR